jgi:hypothetical protein
MPESKVQELLSEFKTVLGGRGRFADVILPAVVFLITNALLGLSIAIWSSLIIAVGFLVYRFRKGQSIWYAVGGLGSVGLAILFTALTRSATGYFLPGLITGGLTVAVTLVSLVAKRPLAAWSSHLTRGWPLSWYWHPQVRPAYTEVTWGWVLFFGLRFYIQVQAYLQDAVASLGIIQLLTGWPALIIVLALSYVYGLWRLRHLAGPSVAEFEAGAAPPWQGQRRGF